MNNIFDSSIDKYKKSLIIYNTIFIIGIICILLLLFFMKKKRIYENTLYFLENNQAYLLAKKEDISLLKNNKKIIIDEIEYDYVIEEIEKKDNMYFVILSFPIKLKMDSSKMQIITGEERIIQFIIRIVKGA